MISTLLSLIQKLNAMLLRNRYEYLILIFAFCYLYIVSYSGYLGDDVYNSSLKGLLINTDKSIIDDVLDRNMVWIKSAKRVFPLSFPILSVFVFFQSMFLYKIYLILMTVFCIYLIGCFYSLYIGNSKQAQYVMLFATVSLPLFMPYHSALYSYNGLFQLCFIFAILSLIFVLKYITTQKIIYNILSAFFLLISLLTYEIAFIFFPIIFLLFYSYKRSFLVSLKSSLLHVFVYFVICSVNIFVRLYFDNPSSYDGASANFSFLPIIKTFFFQWSATLPAFTYFVFNGFSFSAIMASINAFDVFLILFFLILLFSITNSNIDCKETYNFRLFFLILIGGIIWLGIAGLYSITIKMQNELRLGLAYSSVLLQNFGLILCAAGVVVLAKKYIKKYLFIPLSCTLCVYFCFVIIVNQQATRNMIDMAANHYKYSKLDLANSISNGLLAHVPPESLIILDNTGVPHNIPDIFATHAGHPVNAVYRPNLGILPDNSSLYIVKNYSSHDFGVVVIGKVLKLMSYSNDGISKYFIVDDVKLYVRNKNSLLGGIFYSDVSDAANAHQVYKSFNQLRLLETVMVNNDYKYSVYNFGGGDLS